MLKESHTHLTDWWYPESCSTELQPRWNIWFCDFQMMKIVFFDLKPQRLPWGCITTAIHGCLNLDLCWAIRYQAKIRAKKRPTMTTTSQQAWKLSEVNSWWTFGLTILFLKISDVERIRTWRSNRSDIVRKLRIWLQQRLQEENKQRAQKHEIKNIEIKTWHGFCHQYFTKPKHKIYIIPLHWFNTQIFFSWPLSFGCVVECSITCPTRDLLVLSSKTQKPKFGTPIIRFL